MTDRNKPRRGGFTLVEMLVVISLMSVVLGLVGTTLHRAMRTHQDARRFCEDESSAWRLSHQLRRDLRATVDVVVGELDGALTISLTQADNRSVAYHFLPQAVQRDERDAEVTRRDRFRIDPVSAWRVEHDAERIVVQAGGGNERSPFRFVGHIRPAPQEAVE